MLGPLEIRAVLRCLPDAIAVRVLAELSVDRVYEAERIVLETLGHDRSDEAHELIASLVRGTVRSGS